MPHKNDQEVFPPYRLVAQFSDGSRLLFDGLTKQQAMDAMTAAQEAHGDIAWYDGVTDQHYEKGTYYELTPKPPKLPFIGIDLTDYHGDGIPDAPFADDG